MLFSGCSDRRAECSCCPPKPVVRSAYAQFHAASNLPSGNKVPLLWSAEAGGLIQLEGQDTIQLAPGYVYLVGYTMLATPEQGQYFQILPYINDQPRPLFSTVASANGTRNASVSGSFMVIETVQDTASVSFSLTYPQGVNHIDLTGVVWVVPIAATT